MSLPYIHVCIQEENEFSGSLADHFSNINATTICKEYAGIKTYRFMLYRLLGHQDTATISNATILSIAYLLQKSANSLQEIQVSLITHYYTCNIAHLIFQYDINNRSYCLDYNEEIQSFISNQAHNVLEVLYSLYRRNIVQWLPHPRYPTLFDPNSSNSSLRHIQYETFCENYMSLFTALTAYLQ